MLPQKPIINGEYSADVLSDIEQSDGYLHPQQGCPYFGLEDDPDTRLLFASAMGHCHRAHPHGPVKLEHQQAYCLTSNHINCPVFARQRQAPLPPDLLLPEAKTSPKWPILFRVIVQVLILTIFVFLALGIATVIWPRLQELTLSPPVVPPPTSTAMAQIVGTVAPTATSTATATAVPTRTPTPSPTHTSTPTHTPLPTLPPTFTRPAPNTPTPPPTAVSRPTLAVVSESFLNIRTGPNTAYPILKLAAPGEEYQVIGRLEDNSWWQICCIVGEIGWVFGEGVEVAGDFSNIPVITKFPPLPTVTFTPAP